MVAGQYDCLRPGTRVDLLMSLKTEQNVRDLFSLVRADHGRDHMSRAMAELEIIRSVKLTADQRDLGPRSGTLLREHQAQALAHSTRTGTGGRSAISPRGRLT
jgi:tRNA nucleotidyltransferase (CCA-adding enzyme)